MGECLLIYDQKRFHRSSIATCDKSWVGSCLDGVGEFRALWGDSGVTYAGRGRHTAGFAALTVVLSGLLGWDRRWIRTRHSANFYLVLGGFEAGEGFIRCRVVALAA
ncbi:MAG: hypothetical protein V3V08_06265 [Nannocystaceae bacterium]